MAALPEPRIFNDSVHGPIQLDPLLVRIIDTPQFQRLRDIKQLGVCYWVYPGASHNRFEHCIGSSYICSEMINRLRLVHRKPPAAQANEKPTATQTTGNETEELITDYESLCLQIAALCRDLGYGPFSHFFHEVLVPKLMDSRAQTSGSDNANASDCTTIKWARDASCKMFDFMLKKNPTLEKALDEKLNPESDEDKGWQGFIKDLIRGKDSKDVKERCSFEGSHNFKKSFLYEMVSNKRTRIDCNKFDYISRDCHNVGVKNNFDWRRYLLNIRIKKVRGSAELQIHARDKDYFNLSNLFYTRWSLYHSVYRHKTIAGIEDMLSEAILKVDRKLKISNLIKDDWLLNEDDESMRRYTKLTDRIFYQILELEEQSEQATGSSAQERSQSEEAFGVHALQESSKSEKATGSSAQERSQSEQAIDSSPQERSQSEQATGTSAQATGSSPQERSQSEQAAGRSAQERSQLTAKELLQNIQQRNLYKFCGEAKFKKPSIGKANRNKKAFAKEIADESNGEESNGEEKVSEDDVFIYFAHFHRGKEDKNPIDDVPFFTKSFQQQYYPTDEGTFHECYIRVYAKLPGQKRNVQNAFQEWCHSNSDKVTSGLPNWLNDTDPEIRQESYKQD